MKRTILVVLLVLVVGSTALAAPLGQPGADAHALAGESTAQESTAQESNAQETTEREPTAQESTEEYPPGLSSEGVTDPLALANAHRDALSNVSYTMTTTVTFQRLNGSILSQGTTTTRVAADGSSFYVVNAQTQWNDSRPLGVGGYELAAWANETSAVVAHQFGEEEPTYRQMVRDDVPFEPDAQWGLLYTALSATNTAVVSQFEDNGTTLYRVVSTAQPGQNSTYSDRGAYSFVAIVDSQGIVRTMQMTSRSTFNNEPVVVSRTMHVTQLGNTTVERPAWYGKAVGNDSENGTETTTENATETTTA